jgi:hypothetical protein
MNPTKITFQFGDGGTHDASVTETSAVVQLCFQYGWLLIPVSSGLDAAPTWTLEVSTDGVNFAPYDPLTEDAAIDQPFDDTHANAIYWRIAYDAQTNTTGTVEFTIGLKQ